MVGGPDDEVTGEWVALAVHPGMAYEEYLATPAWRQKRADMLRRAGHRCQVCNGTGRLEVHHRTYDRLGAERPDDLIVLCHACHQTFHTHRPLALSSHDRTSWCDPAALGMLACFVVAAWAFLHMRPWDTYHTDPGGYLWRFARFYGLIAAGFAIGSSPRYRPHVILGAVLLFGLILAAIEVWG